MYLKVATEGDSVLGAYHEARDAVAFVQELQLELLKADWPVGLADHELCARVERCQFRKGADSAPLFAGLRVRAAVHAGIPSSIEVSPKCS